MDKKKLTKKKNSEGTSTTSIFNSDLQKICQEYNYNKRVICNILSSEITAGEHWQTYFAPRVLGDDVINIYIAYENFDRIGEAIRLYIKNEEVCVTFLEVMLTGFFQKYSTITTIRFEYCNLSHEEIEFLQLILKDYPQITDVNLDGNPNETQSFSCILEDTNLKYLSLKRCKINENGLKQLCENLITPNMLISLNLTGNYIDDNSVAYLANMLKQNRTLRSINLADNWITDLGCLQIMKSLESFVLTHEEIVIKRKINFEYYSRRLEMIKQFFQDCDNNSDENDFENTKKYPIITSKMLEHINELLKKFRLNKNSSKGSFSSNTSNGEKQLIYFIDENCPAPNHPFVNDIIKKDKEIHCTGNFHLTSLNLAYNKLSSTGYKFIIDTLNYQLLNNNLGMGLTFIDLDGNVQQTSNEFYDIYRNLMEKRMKSIKNSKTSVSRRSKNSV